MNPSDARLESEARRFAEDLSETVRAVVGDQCPPFRGAWQGARLTIAQDPADGIVLYRRETPLMRLEAEYGCEWDHAGTYLRVAWSRIVLFPGDPSETVPYFRYEYDRKDAVLLPDAHLQVHDDPGHTSRLAELMLDAGTDTKRSRRRVKRGAAAKHELHFPLGGDRFRPALEDVLQILVEEFGVRHEPGWQHALAEARIRWRRFQLASAVRDSPEVAAAVLVSDLGYTVEPPDTGHPEPRRDRLAAI